MVKLIYVYPRQLLKLFTAFLTFLSISVVVCVALANYSLSYLYLPEPEPVKIEYVTHDVQTYKIEWDNAYKANSKITDYKVVRQVFANEFEYGRKSFQYGVIPDTTGPYAEVIATCAKTIKDDIIFAEYREVMDGKIVEYAVCPVYVDGKLRPPSSITRKRKPETLYLVEDEVTTIGDKDESTIYAWAKHRVQDR